MEKENLFRAIDYLEFGVAGGDTLSWWVRNNKDPETRFIGFDTFEGLPERWGPWPKGSFGARGELPEIQDSRCSYEVGFFQKTIFEFLKRCELNRRTVIHIDSDLYDSAFVVLTGLAPYLKRDDIIIFDNFCIFRCAQHEFRAFYDFFSAYKFSYKLIAVKLISVTRERELPSPL
jgi:hypothetical protein